MNQYLYLIIALISVSSILFSIIRRRDNSKINNRSIEKYQEISQEEREAYDAKLENVLNNTILTFSVDNETEAFNNCNNYYGSVLHGAKLLEEDGFRFPDMRGI